MGSGGGRRVGVDTGGTFTDVVDESGVHVKVLSDRVDPASAVRRGVVEVGAAVDVLAHGTTVATNTLLERAGGRVALVDERGPRGPHRDRSSGSALVVRPMGRPPRATGAAAWRYGVRGRVAVDGTELVPLDVAGLAALAPEIETVAVLSLARGPVARTRESRRRGPEGVGSRRGRVARRVARASRVRATRHHGRQRVRATGVQ